MSSKYIILFFSIFQASQSVSAQVTQEWVARYSYFSEDVAEDIAIDGSGNVYVTGYSYATNGYEDYATIKYNASGIGQWVQRYNGPGNHFDSPAGLVLDDSGNVYVSGTSNRIPIPGQPNYDIATIKYSSNGVQQWEKRYNGGSDDAVSAGIVMDAQGNIYVGGRNAAIGYVVIKYNPNGDTLWVRTFSNAGTGARAITVDLSGNVYVTGRNATQDWLTVKWNSLGNFQWSKTFNGPGSGSDVPEAIAAGDSGNVYVTGYVWGNNNTDYATVKYDAGGDLKWAVYYNGGSMFTAGDGAYSIALDDTENVYITGASTNPNVATSDYATIKYSSAGVQQWISRFNGPANNDDAPCCIKLDTAGNVYVSGYSTISLSPTNRDYCTIKYDNSGVQQWLIYYNGTESTYDGANALAVGSNGYVYVTGNSRGIGNNDYATVKYSQPTGIIQISNEIPDAFKLYQNYPNPFNPITHIGFRIVNYGLVNLTTYDILGRKVEALVSEELSQGTYEIKWDAIAYPSGVYFYTLITSGFTETKKMILNK